MHEFVHEYLHHYVALEGKLWRTLWTLIRRPGLLTIEYIRGRRRRYVKPLALYITTSFLFFLLTALIPTGGEPEERPDEASVATRSTDAGKSEASPDSRPKSRREGHGVSSAATQGGATQEPPEQHKEIAEGLDIAKDAVDDTSPWLERLAERARNAHAHYKQDPEGTKERWWHNFRARIPYLIFLMMPMFAFGSWVLYFRRKRYYGEHFLMALHLHAFVFLSLLLTWWLPIPGMTAWLSIGWWIYIAQANRRVFGGGLFGQLCRSTLLLTGQAVALSLGGLILIVVVLLSA
ncbi:DUF3667 domain-containing protein [Chitinimonas naiadis]